MTANIYAASNTAPGPVNMSVVAANLGDGDPRANFTSNAIPFNVGTGSGGGTSTVTTVPPHHGNTDARRVADIRYS